MKNLSRSYFETQIVKVKKERPKHKYFTTQKMDGKLYGFYYNKKYKMDIHIEEIKKKSKGNWVNGENLDKIKFPCFCSYKSQRYPMKGKRFAGMIFQNENYYYLFDVHDQYQEKVIAKHWYRELKYMIREHDIHILKGKIIIFEEEK